MNEDWDYFMGENVVIGKLLGVVVGQCCFSYKSDEYEIQVINDDGLPNCVQFPASFISKSRKN